MGAESRADATPPAGRSIAHRADLTDSRSSANEAPVPGTIFFLPVDGVALYEHNARLVPNPEKPRIRASIEASGGLTHPLMVTKRPGADHFMVQQGGNTRLAIMKELAAAAPPGDTRFDRIKVVYAPYTGELDIAVHHDRENNLRGGLSFIEQAKAKRTQFELFAAEVNDPSQTTVKTFTSHLAERYGDDLSPELFYRMRYATDVLYEWIPTMLVHGRMTLGAVRELVTFRKRLCSVWVDHGFGDKRGFEAVFYALLARQDREFQQLIDSESIAPDAKPEALFKLDYARVRLDFQNELAEMEAVPNADYQTMGLWIGAALNRSDLERYEALADLETDDPGGATPDPTAATTPLRPSTPRTPPRAVNAPPPRAPEATPAAVPHALLEAHDIKSLRGRCYTVAMKIAQRNGFGELIAPTPRTGHGFIVTDIFPDDWWDTLPKDTLVQRQVCWWILAMCSHTFDLPERALKSELPESSLLRDAWLTQDMTLVSRTMGVLGVNAHLAHISERDWDDFLALLGAYRQLIASANSTENV